MLRILVSDLLRKTKRTELKIMEAAHKPTQQYQPQKNDEIELFGLISAHNLKSIDTSPNNTNNQYIQCCGYGHTMNSKNSLSSQLNRCYRIIERKFNEFSRFLTIGKWQSRKRRHLFALFMFQHHNVIVFNLYLWLRSIQPNSIENNTI